MQVLEVNGVSKTYGNHTALSNVTFSVKQGIVFGLLGPNGAGKTTLIRIINQIIGPDKGSIQFLGAPLKRSDISKIGYLPEERGLYKKMRVGEHLLYLAQLKGLDKQTAKERVKELLIEFEAGSWWEKKIEELSKGMAQKLQFISTIVHQPTLLILDEPFSGFDPVNAEAVKGKVLQLKSSGTTIILSTHRMESVEELCDSIVLVNESKTVLAGKIDEIKRNFKSDIFEVTFQEDGGLHDLPPSFQLQSKEQRNGDIIARFALNEGAKPNDLLSFLIKDHQIFSFKEILPSIQDIFIQTVKKKEINA